MTAFNTPTPEEIAAFKEAWTAADVPGNEGHRVEAGLEAVFALRDKTCITIELNTGAWVSGTTLDGLRASAIIAASVLPGMTVEAVEKMYREYMADDMPEPKAEPPLEHPGEQTLWEASGLDES